MFFRVCGIRHPSHPGLRPMNNSKTLESLCLPNGPRPTSCFPSLCGILTTSACGCVALLDIAFMFLMVPENRRRALSHRAGGATSPLAGSARSAPPRATTPGPGSYQLSDTIGRQVVSTRSSSPAFVMGSSCRDDYAKQFEGFGVGVSTFSCFVSLLGPDMGRMI
jgi:hypothetical protein